MSTPPPPQGGYPPYGQQPYQGSPQQPYQGPPQPPYQGQAPYQGAPQFQGPPQYQGAPPHQGAAPYQGQPPYGQPPYGQPQFNQQPVPPARTRSPFNSRSPLFRVATFAVAAVAVGAYYLVNGFDHKTPSTSADTSEWTASVGDCLTNNGSESSPDMEVVGCSSSKAEYRIEQTGSTSECEDGQLKYTKTRRTTTLLTMCISEIEK
ncbi:hypothetical protein ACFVYF_26920 [Streptomyces sp. NPDC058274]|uniref:LppU/SCO3897 family protein n=1 Tax=Streptomyces sp. NPDC058274 TaxID=3346416 RepID=UPI0036E1E77E